MMRIFISSAPSWPGTSSARASSLERLSVRHGARALPDREVAAGRIERRRSRRRRSRRRRIRRRRWSRRVVVPGHGATVTRTGRRSRGIAPGPPRRRDRPPAGRDGSRRTLRRVATPRRRRIDARHRRGQPPARAARLGRRNRSRPRRAARPAGAVHGHREQRVRVRRPCLRRPAGGAATEGPLRPRAAGLRPAPRAHRRPPARRAATGERRSALRPRGPPGVVRRAWHRRPVPQSDVPRRRVRPGVAVLVASICCHECGPAGTTGRWTSWTGTPTAWCR